MTTSDFPRYAFPRITKVSLHSFSLYVLQPNITVDCSGGVLCLAGANGIGKSTFLATVNYGLTGAVPHPRRKLHTLEAYWKMAIDYSKDFFSGRISELDRENAAVTIDFAIAGTHYRICRGLFDSNDVRHFELNGTPQECADRLTTPSLRSDLYREKITKVVGVNSFEQFVFLQHFVLTFDESRHLLFWDETATARSLFLAFGGDPQEAARHDQLSREAEQAGSRGRNMQFQVNNVRKRIDAIQQSMAGAFPSAQIASDIDEQYKDLEERARLAAERHDLAEAKVTEAEIRLAERSASVASLRAAYTETFNRFLHRSAKPSTHPLVARAVSEGACGVCDANGPEVISTVKSRLNSKHCPFCGTQFEGVSDNDVAAKAALAEVDTQLARARTLLSEATAASARLREESKAARAATILAQETLGSFESSHQEAINAIKARQSLASGPLAQTLEGLTKAMEEFSAQRDYEYATRDRLRDEVKRLHRSLEIRYAHAETEFLPRFKTLAGAFLGVDLDVMLQTTMPAGIKLVVELRGHARHEETQMSESQRFFVDIALRMALAQQISSQNSPAALFIDTPEGSLDIAYEDRAGEMFAQFVESSHDIFMTANINSSKLLTTLARRCGHRSMKLNPMTGWTELTEVQQNATSLFQSAYHDITAALNDGPTI